MMRTKIEINREDGSNAEVYYARGDSDSEADNGVGLYVKDASGSDVIVSIEPDEADALAAALMTTAAEVRRMRGER